MTHFFFVLFFFSLCIFSLLLPFIFLISYCSLTLLPDDSRFALVTAPPTVSPPSSLKNSHQAPLPIPHPGFFTNTWNWEARKLSKIVPTPTFNR